MHDARHLTAATAPGGGERGRRALAAIVFAPARSAFISCWIRFNSSPFLPDRAAPSPRDFLRSSSLAWPISNCSFLAVPPPPAVAQAPVQPAPPSLTLMPRAGGITGSAFASSADEIGPCIWQIDGATGDLDVLVRPAPARFDSGLGVRPEVRRRP